MNHSTVGHAAISFLILSLFTSLAFAEIPHPLLLEEIGVGTVDGLRLDGIGYVDRSGHTCTGVGDFNGDGIEDFMTNGIVADPQGKTSAGEAYLILGSPDPIGAGGVLSLSDLDGTNGFAIWGDQTQGQLGSHLFGAGDVNNDGFSDIIVAANRADWNGRIDSGIIYLIYGNSTLPGTAGVLKIADIDESMGVVIGGWAPGDLSATGTGLGDVNGDGIDDFGVSSVWADISLLNSGSVHIIFGSESGIGDGGVLDLAALDSSDGVSIHGIYAGGIQRELVGVGDFNGDGHGDIAIGAHLAPTGDSTAVGTAFLIFGPINEIGASGEIDLNDLNGENGVMIVGVQTGEIFGSPLRGTGDVNGDGLADLAIPAIHADIDGNLSAGRTYLIYGTSHGIGENGVFDLSTLTPGTGMRIEGVVPQANSGYQAGGAGDIDGDGLADLLLGAETADSYSQRNPGIAHTIYGSAVDISTNGVLQLDEVDGDNGIAHQGYHNGDATGRGAGAAGDINADGISDYLVGSYFADVNGVREAGRTTLIFGQSDAQSATYRRWLPGGTAPLTGIGMIGDGSHSIPFSRCWIGYADGHGPGVGCASLQCVTIMRTDTDVSERSITPDCTWDRIADVLWCIRSNRCRCGDMKVQVHYLDSEIEGLDEERLRLFGARSPEGPWINIPHQRLEADRNQIGALVPPIGMDPLYLAIADVGDQPPADFDQILNHILGLIPEDPSFDTNLDGQIDAADLVITTP